MVVAWFVIFQEGLRSTSEYYLTTGDLRAEI